MASIETEMRRALVRSIRRSINELAGSLDEPEPKKSGPTPDEFALAAENVKLRNQLKEAEAQKVYLGTMASERMKRIEERQQTVDELRETCKGYVETIEKRDYAIACAYAENRQLKVDVEMGKRALEGRDLQIDRLKTESNSPYCTMCHAEDPNSTTIAAFVASGHSVCARHVDEVIEGGV